MVIVDVHQVKTHGSELVAVAEGGEDIVIARAGAPVVRLVPVASAGRRGRARRGGPP